MVEVETEVAWVGDMAKAEVLLSAIEGHDFADIELVTECDGSQVGIRIIVKGDDLRKVRSQVDTLLAALSVAESNFDE
ncbi:MAG: hypothetical protein CMB18_02550 [Euryarchaeota archaeon]|nr:hypothetical protein [Euryarchaeota archaeon]|tara:strand:- start:1942 stop:2175 length:234 start_codon:yes stop_codon:yes gene_type:complete